MLHAPVVQHLLGHRSLRRPVEEDVDQEEAGDGDVEAGEALPAQKVGGRIAICRRGCPAGGDEVVEAEDHCHFE